MVIGLLACATLAFASGPEEGGHHEAPSILTLAFPLINFAIYLWILNRFAWPKISAYLGERRQLVIEALEAASRAKQHAEALKAEYERKLAGLEEDARRVQGELRAMADLEARRLLEAAEANATRVRADAQLVADQELARARREIQGEAARLIAEVAERLLQSNLNAADQERFLQRFLSGIDAQARLRGAGAGTRA